MDARSRPVMVGGSFDSNSLLNWSGGSSRAQVWDIGLFMLSCSRSRSLACSRFGYVSQSYAPYGMLLGVKNSALIVRELQVSPREL